MGITLKRLSVMSIGILMFTVAGCATGTEPMTPDPAPPVKNSPVKLAIENVDPDGSLNFDPEKSRAEIVDGKIIYQTAGSGSCPPTVAEAEYVDDTATLWIADFTDKACTMDLRPYKQHISLPSGEDFPDGTRIDIIDPKPIA